MRRPHFLQPFTLVLVSLALATAACSLQTGPQLAAAPPTDALATEAPAALQPTAPLIPASLTPDASPTLASTATSDLSVRVTATGGNLTLRRGPATAYNVLNYMLQGQAAVATGRNQAGDWLFVQDPAGGGRTAWVTATSRYAVVDGGAEAVQALPVQTVGPAEPAYIRNCTFHPMRIMPADLLLKEKFDEPNNVHMFNPGVYEAFDQSAEGKPKVMSEELREGKTIDINTDGLHNTYGCTP